MTPSVWGWISTKQQNSRSQHGEALSYASGIQTATRRPPKIPDTLNVPPGATNIQFPSICRAPPWVPGPLTFTSADTDESVLFAKLIVPLTTTSLAKAQSVRVMVQVSL